MPEKILVIKLSALGDFIQALGPMAAIRRHHPEAHITLLTTEPFLSFAEKCGYFNDAVVDPRPKIFDVKGWLELRHFLRAENFTRVYDLQNNDRTNTYFQLFPRTARPEWIGTARGATHRNTSPDRTAGHALDGHIQTLGLAGIQNIAIDALSWIKEDISAFALKKPYVLLVAGSAPQHPHKRWPADSYGALANHLLKKNLQPVLIGTKAEADVTQRIKTLCPQAVDLTGETSLFQIATLAREAHSAVGNDTGPMHMIAPTGCPCLVLFSGSSNPKRHVPKGKSVQILQKEPLSKLDVQDVYNAFETFLTGQKQSATVEF